MPVLALFGAPVLTAAGDVIVSGRAAQRHCLALLTLLAGERRGLSRERVVAYLWPESDPPTARHRLSVALHVLRESVGAASVVTAGDALRLAPEQWRIDAWQFEDECAGGDFQAALGHYRGPLLDGFFLRGAPEFEQWLERWRERLARRRSAVLGALAQEAEGAGDVAGHVAYRQELSVEDPCSGTCTVALMRALAAAGRVEAALRCARAYTLRVSEEYGLGPDPAVLACANTLAAPRRIRATS